MTTSYAVPVSDPALSYLQGLTASEGYQLLSKNLTKSVQQFENTSSVQSNIQYFEKTTSTLTNVNDFVNNPRLVDFVLSAFGLDSEAPYQGLIKQVLTQNPNSSSSLVNQLTDPRFKQLATALDFYDDGLGRLQGVGLPTPTEATQAEPGANLTPANATKPVALGVTVTGNNYLVLQKPDGTTAYAQSAFFTLNSSNQLATSDGSLLSPVLTFPSDTTGVTIDSTGQIYAQESSSKTPTSIGVLEVANFSRPSQLAQSNTGYLTPTSFSGSANLAPVTNGQVNVFTNTYQDLVNQYVTNEFESTVGTYNNGVHEALYFQRNVGPDEEAAGSNKETQIDVLLGDTVLRDVVTTALGQPQQIVEQSLARQEQIFSSGIDTSQLQNSSYVTQFTQRYLTIYDSQNAPSVPTSPALQILSAFGGGSSSSSSGSGSNIINLAV